jgi:hypothetical protein
LESLDRGLQLGTRKIMEGVQEVLRGFGADMRSLKFSWEYDEAGKRWALRVFVGKRHLVLRVDESDVSAWPAQRELSEKYLDKILHLAECVGRAQRAKRTQEPVAGSNPGSPMPEGGLMPFSPRDINAAWTRSGAICECTDAGHDHGGRCAEKLLWSLQGAELGGGWRAIRMTTWGTDTLANCQIRCAKCQGPVIKPKGDWR